MKKIVFSIIGKALCTATFPNIVIAAPTLDKPWFNLCP